MKHRMVAALSDIWESSTHLLAPGGRPLIKSPEAAFRQSSSLPLLLQDCQHFNILSLLYIVISETHEGRGGVLLE